MAKRDYFNILLGIADVKANSSLVDFIKHELELLDKKNSQDRKPTATQIANEGLKKEIYEVLSASPSQLFTVTEIMKTSPTLEELSNQKVSALLRQLVEAGKVEKLVEKRKSYFRYKD